MKVLHMVNELYIHSGATSLLISSLTGHYSRDIMTMHRVTFTTKSNQPDLLDLISERVILRFLNHPRHSVPYSDQLFLRALFEKADGVQLGHLLKQMNEFGREKFQKADVKMMLDLLTQFDSQFTTR